MKTQKTILERYNSLINKESVDNREFVKFILSHDIRYSNLTIRKYKLGVKVTNPRTSEVTYYETDHRRDFILSYPIIDGKVGQCNGEVVVEDIVNLYKRTHDLIKD